MNKTEEKALNYVKKTLHFFVYMAEETDNCRRLISETADT